MSENMEKQEIIKHTTKKTYKILGHKVIKSYNFLTTGYYGKIKPWEYLPITAHEMDMFFSIARKILDRAGELEREENSLER